MKTQEVKTYVVDVCQKVILKLAKDHKIEDHHLNIRIDMENQQSKPIFGLFHVSKFLAHSSLKEIIHAGGGMGMSMLLGMYIRNIIRDIFIASLKRFELNDTKDIFVLLYIKEEDENKTPMIAIYKKGELVDAIEVGGIIGDTNDNIQT